MAASPAVSSPTSSSSKGKDKLYLFVLLGAAVLVFCIDVFLLRTTNDVNSRRGHDVPAWIVRQQQQHQQHQRTSLIQDKYSRRLERRNSLRDGRLQQQPQQPSSRSSSSGGAFVHIGKTGGSTISKLLRNGCHAVYPKPCRNVTNETIISQLVSDYYHGKSFLYLLFSIPGLDYLNNILATSFFSSVPDFWKLPTSNHKFYIVSVRDPLDRTVSAFVYGHPKNIRARGEEVQMNNISLIAGRVAYRCFPSLERWADHLGEDSYHFDYPMAHDYLDSRNCTSLARAAIHNRVRFFSHLFFNMESVITKIPATTNQPTLYAIRQEHLWKDWKDVNHLLGQRGEIVIPHQSNLRNVATVRQPVKRKLSDAGRDRLCRALEEEYKTYFGFLKKAVNVKETDVTEAMEYSKRQCPNLRLG
jgi:hypothetical protein